jgi:putative sigma-54 modulation protein
MQVTITGRHVEVTAGLKSSIHTKLLRLEELFPKAKKVQVVLTVEKYRHTAEIHFHAEHVEFSAKKTTKDMYASVDAAIKALEQQAVKKKGKLHSSKALRAGSAKVEAKSRSLGRGSQEAPALPRIVRQRRLDSKPMREEDAAMELLESGKDFLVYEDARTGRAHVLFKREDGNFGLIEA